MSTLNGFPMVSQLSNITSDGRPSEDAQFECVPASIGAGILWYQGKSQWDTAINPDLLKDAAYGESWQNMGTAASSYVPFCQKLGFSLWHFDAIPSILVNEAHKQIQAGFPVVFTEPDPYVSASLGWSHVCVFYSEAPGLLTAMDPYIARPVQRTDQEWEGLLQFNQIWVLEKTEVDMSITIQTPVVPDYFKELNANQWQRLTPNSSGGYPIIQGAILLTYKSYGNFGLCGLTDWGLPNSNEMLIEKYWPVYAHLAGKGIVVQYYERCCVIYDPQHLFSNPPGAGPVYKLAVYESPSPGADPLIAQLQAKLAQQPVPAQPLVDAISQIKAIVAKV